jgi:hypothetical protein
MMDAVLTIDSEEAVRHAGQLAELTGESVAEAVVRALRDSLRREQSARERAASILDVAAEMRSHLGGPFHSADHASLYGDDGLPA